MVTDTPNQNRWKLIVVGLIVVGVGLGIVGLYAAKTKKSPTNSVQADTGATTLEATGHLVKTGDYYAVTGDSRFPKNLLIENSRDPQVIAKLEPLLNQSVTVSGTRRNDTTIVADLLNHQPLLPEASTTPFPGAFTFAQLYASLPAVQRDCLKVAIGETTIDALSKNQPITMSSDQNGAMNKCLAAK